MAKGVTYKTYLKLVKEILTNNDDIISQQYIGLNESFYRENIQKWVNLFSNRNDYDRYKYGFSRRNFFTGLIYVRKDSEYFNQSFPEDLVGAGIKVVNDKQFISVMIAVECIWSKDVIDKLLNKYK